MEHPVSQAHFDGQILLYVDDVRVRLLLLFLYLRRPAAFRPQQVYSTTLDRKCERNTDCWHRELGYLCHGYVMGVFDGVIRVLIYVNCTKMFV